MTNMSWDVGLPPESLSRIQAGVLATRYRGRRLLKSPFDLVLYMQLIDSLAPRTVIEIGAKEGGSALWFADQLSLRGIAPQIVAVDLEPPSDFEDPRIRFVQGDANDLANCLAASDLRVLPRPWLVVEDSAHLYAPCLAVLEFFDEWLERGDYIVIEDGVIRDLPDPVYDRFENGPNRAVAAFLKENAGHYEISRALCDFYGPNVTYNPNGWLRKMA